MLKGYLSGRCSLDFRKLNHRSHEKVDRGIYIGRKTLPEVKISSFSSVMLSVGMFGYNSLTFSVFTLTILQSWILRDSNVIFFSVIIFSVDSIFILSS